MSPLTDPESWNELGALLVNALEVAPEERAHFLDEACQSSPKLRAEVESLLAAYEEAPAYFGALGRDLLPAPQDEKQASSTLRDPYQLVGQSLAQYQVQDLLGGGGMGLVYKAEDSRLGRTVALKFLPPFLSQDPNAKQRFLKEAQAASALDHPNICTIFDVGETPEGQLYIAMAYYEGETLQRKIARGPLPVDVALDLASQMARGLARAHARGIVHRDVKPANAIATTPTPEQAGNGVVKLLDFGLAKLTGGATITRTGATLGTAAYMSPEQARGEAVDHRTDIWSLGVVLYEMLAGQRPFQGDYGPAILYAVLNQDAQPITGLRAGLPMQLGLIINKALAKTAAERYQHMTDLLADLEAVQQRQAARSMVEQAVLPAL